MECCQHLGGYWDVWAGEPMWVHKNCPGTFDPVDHPDRDDLVLHTACGTVLVAACQQQHLVYHAWVDLNSRAGPTYRITLYSWAGVPVQWAASAGGWPTFALVDVHIDTDPDEHDDDQDRQQEPHDGVTHGGYLPEG